MSDFVQNASELKRNVTHVIFDMDGLLLSTEKLYDQAANVVAEKFAKDTVPRVITWDRKVGFMGLQKEDLAKVMVKDLNLTCTPEQYLEETSKLHVNLFPQVIGRMHIWTSTTYGVSSNL